MSKRPSARYNDPGYFYNTKRLLIYFTFSGAALMAGILAMIWVDFDRPWKDGQRAQMKWEAGRLALEQFLLETQTQQDRRELERERAKAQKKYEAMEKRRVELEAELATARGSLQGNDLAFKGKKQYTGQATYLANEAADEAEHVLWAGEYRREKDTEDRLRDATQLATKRVKEIRDELAALRAGLDEVVAKERANPRLKRLEIVTNAMEKKESYSPLRELPLLDFLAPPTRVEQVVLENLVDNYEFSTPRKVDRCGTCHIGVMRLGFEDYQWPVEILDLEPGDPRKVEKFEQAVYRFVFRMIDGYTPGVPSGSPYAHELALKRTVGIHHATLDLLFLGYDAEEGTIGVDEKTGRKLWRRWQKKDGKWVSGKQGTSVGEYFLDLLERMEPQWQTHPWFDDMVSGTSPHPYEQVGCTVCHQGRGWSVDFGLAYHTPDRVKVEDWMTTERAHEEGHHDPANVEYTLEETMLKGNPGQPVHVGWVPNDEKAERWEENLGWTHEKLHYWLWPQLPKMLVQSSCLKCHKEGYLQRAEEEYEHVRLGKPDPKVPDVFEFELHAAAFNDPDAEGSAAKIFIPEEPERYRPANLERGLDNFLRFGCYACHKLDPAVYPFMENVRPRVGPPLDDITAKTSRTFLQKWIRNPKDLRPETRMPRFWGLSNNSHDFRYRFADTGWEEVDGDAWADAEIYAITEYLIAASAKRGKTLPPVDLTGADPARGERILIGDYDASKFEEAGRVEHEAKACIACHEVPIRTPELQYKADEMASWFDKRTRTEQGWKRRMSRKQGPDLAGLGSKAKPEWLYSWLKNPQGWWHDTNMPSLRLTDQEAKDVAAYLLSFRNETFDALPGVEADDAILARMAQELKVSEMGNTRAGLAAAKAMDRDERVSYVGGKLIKHYGCFGCHEIEEFKETTPIGTELTEWGSKLIDRLEFLHAPIPHERFDFAYAKMINPRIYDRGVVRRDLPYERLRMPRFGFTPEEARDLSTFLVGLVNDIIPPAARYQADERHKDILRGRQVVHRYNCQGCHVIEGEGGDIWPVVARDKWRPPDLLGEGRKVQPDWLFRYLQDPAFVSIPGQANTDRVRPWHSIRMPTFPLTEEENRALVKYFAALSDVNADFVSPPEDSLAGPESVYEKPKVLEIKDAAGTGSVRVRAHSRLEETVALFKQYQCKSCHVAGDQVPVEQQAPDFRHTRAGRLREDWIEIWLWGPSKLQAGTAMPTFFAGPSGPVAQDKQFFGADPGAQIRALRDYIRYHYREED